jgi:hypothetical protein
MMGRGDECRGRRVLGGALAGRVGRAGLLGLALVSLLALTPAVGGADVEFVQIIDGTGDGVNPLKDPRAVTTDRSGNVYVAGLQSHNVFKIEPDGTTTQIIDLNGDGVNLLLAPSSLAADSTGNLYIAGSGSDNVFRITPGGVITQIMDATGDGLGNTLSAPAALATDTLDNLYVTGGVTDNAFMRTSGGAITQIIDSTGDGTNGLTGPFGIAVDRSGMIYVTGFNTSNAFKLKPGGKPRQLIDANGDLETASPLDLPFGISVSQSGRVYVAGSLSHNMFEIKGSDITEFIGPAGVDGNALLSARQTAVDLGGNVYVTGRGSDNAFVVRPDRKLGPIATEIMDFTGDGLNPLASAEAVHVGGSGRVYISGSDSDNVFASDAFPVFGKKIIIKDKLDDPTVRLVNILAKDPFVAVPRGADAADPSVSGATVRIYNPLTLEDVTFTLPPAPAGNWIALGNGLKGFKYSDPKGDNGPCKLLLAKPGKLLKVVCLGSLGAIPFTLDEGFQGEIIVEFQVGQGPTMCATFASNPGAGDKDTGVGVDGKPVGLFKVTGDENAPLPATCTAP